MYVACIITRVVTGDATPRTALFFKCGCGAGIFSKKKCGYSGFSDRNRRCGGSAGFFYVAEKSAVEKCGFFLFSKFFAKSENFLTYEITRHIQEAICMRNFR